MAIKLFGTEARNTFLPRVAVALTNDGRANGNDQGHVYVAASSKKAAGELLQSAGLSTAKSSLALDRACGNDLQAVLDAGEGPAEGELIALPMRGKSVLHYSPAAGWTLVGKVTPAGFVSKARVDELERAVADVHTCRERFAPDHDLYASYTLVLDAARDRLAQLTNALGEA